MLNSSLLEVALHSPSVQATVVLLTIAFLVQWYLDTPPKPKFPKAELDKDDYHGSLMRAKTKYGIKPFLFETPQERIILPNHLFDEVKNLPNEQLSFRESVKKILNAKYTGVGVEMAHLAGAVKNDLTLNINSTLAMLQDEVDYAVQTEIGPCPEATAVKVYEKLLRIVALASGRIFIGRPLSRDEEWIDISVNFTVNASQTAFDVQGTPLLLRWCCVPFYKSIRKSIEYRRRLQQKLEPLLAPLLEASKGHQIEDENSDYSALPNDYFNLAAWSMRYYEPGEQPTAKSLTSTLISAAFAAIHTTTVTLTHVLYDLASHPECITILREELEPVLAEDAEGRLRKRTVPRLRQMDSFIKESQRMRPLSPIMVTREVTARKGLTLSSGDYLPHGSSIAVGQSRQNSAMDPKYLSPQPPQPPLDEFHPWRFSDLRSIPGEENKHQFVTTTYESTVFGHGKWACPGRFFASNEIKTILIELLLKYDISLGPEGQGEDESGMWKRPKTHTILLGYMPDTTAKIYFRDRKV